MAKQNKIFRNKLKKKVNDLCSENTDERNYREHK